jgi:HK97 family phage prohead protease
LKLAEDAKGLSFELSLPDTSLGRDLLALAERGDLGGMSFGFIAVSDAWPAPDQRVLRDLDLIEISVVQSFPAYVGTSVAARSAPQRGLAWRRRYLEALA